MGRGEGGGDCKTASVMNFSFTHTHTHTLVLMMQSNTGRCNCCLPRSLDLTGPLLLGGVPKLPEDFPVRHRQFVGCMKNLRVDNQHVDMAGFIANNGTLPGVF